MSLPHNLYEVIKLKEQVTIKELEKSIKQIKKIKRETEELLIKVAEYQYSKSIEQDFENFEKMRIALSEKMRMCFFNEFEEKSSIYRDQIINFNPEKHKHFLHLTSESWKLYRLQNNCNITIGNIIRRFQK